MICVYSVSLAIQKNGRNSFSLNRNNPTDKPAHEYDVVIDPIANDRVGAQLWRYENHSIDLSTLVHNLQFMKGITFQYFFCTERAIKLLKRI